MGTKINIIYRTCDVVEAVHGTPRPYGLTKTKLIDLCFKSLVDSLQDIEFDMTILGDRLSDERIKFFQPWCHNLYNGELGNGKSIAECFTLASKLHDEEWVYFCEDDYLHQNFSLKWILDFIQNFNYENLFIHPVDYPDRYTRLEDVNTRWHLFKSNHCHWRQIYNTTYTFLCQVKTFKKFFDIFMKSAPDWNDGLFSEQVYKRNDVLCLSPIPSLACHMHEVCMSPFVDWKKIIMELQND